MSNVPLLADSVSSTFKIPELTLSERQIEKPENEKKEEIKMAIGLGVGIWSLPEESDYEADLIPVTLFFNWKFQFLEGLSLQAGYSTATAKMNYEAYKANWENRLTVQALYLSYRLSHKMTKTLDVYALAGLAFLSAELQVNEKKGDNLEEAGVYHDSGLGYIVGFGFYKTMGLFTIGAEFNTLSRAARFNEIKNAIGYSQILFTGRFQF